MENVKFRKKDLPKLKKEYRKIIRQHKILVSVLAVIIVSCILAIGFSVYNIVLWHFENIKIDEQISDINEVLQIEEVIEDNTDDIELVNPPAIATPTNPDIPKENTPKADPYWDYIKLPLINVNLSELQKINNETVGFLKVNGTNINYPVVQTTDNDFYLTHSFDKEKNSSGWVFMDYRNNALDFDQNTIIYAHGRVNKTMFGSLKNILESNWYQDTDNYVIDLATPTQNTLWQVFSVYKIPTETYYLTSSFGTDESYQTFLDTITNRSVFDFNTTVTTKNRILTLSTCYNKTEKVVLHAKLIKRQIK